MKTVIWRSIDKGQQQALLQRPAIANNPDIREQVADILQNVQQNGDEAIRQYTERFDNATFDSFIAQRQSKGLDPKICQAIDKAYQNIKTFHQKQGFIDYSINSYLQVYLILLQYNNF